MCINDAKSLNLNYEGIREIAQTFSKNLNNKLMNIEEIITKLGGKITYLEAEDFEKSNNFFTLKSQNDFEVITIDKNDLFKKLFLFQALGHYILHAKGGLIPCKISQASKGIAAKEGFYFSLALLIDDELLNKMVHKGLNDKQIANMFRVSEELVKIKKTIMENKDGDKTE